MNRRTWLTGFAFAAAAALAHPSYSQEAAPPAPFGLAWLATTEEIRALGVTLNPVNGGDFGESFTASNLPKALSDLDTVFLSFGFDDRLFRIVAIGREFEKDHYGTSVRARYDELATALAKSYSAGEVYEQRGTDSIYADAENFTYAISQKKAHWFRTFTSADADIELSIGADYTDAHWRLIYAHREGAKAFEDGKGARETDAL